MKAMALCLWWTLQGVPGACQYLTNGTALQWHHFHRWLVFRIGQVLIVGMHPFGAGAGVLLWTLDTAERIESRAEASAQRHEQALTLMPTACLQRLLPAEGP